MNAIPSETESNRASMEPVLSRPSMDASNKILVQNQEGDKENADPSEEQLRYPTTRVDNRQAQNFAAIVADIDMQNELFPNFALDEIIAGQE